MNRNILLVPIGILALGILPLPIGYYTLLRIVVCVCAAYVAWRYFEENDNLAWVFGFVAVLYNPLLPVYLNSKLLWTIINVPTIGIFVYQYFKTPKT